MKYLLDTNIVSEARKPQGNAGVKRWIASTPREDLHLSVLTLGEVRRGVERLRRWDPEQAGVYEAWLYTVLLAACSAGILGAGVALTRRLFRDEVVDDVGGDGAR